MTKSNWGLAWAALLVIAVFGGIALLVLRQPEEPSVSNGELISESGQMAAQEQQATKESPFINTLGMKFVPVPGTTVLFCVHETRHQDYATYANAVPGADGSWKTQNRDGVPCGNEDNHPVVGMSWNDAQKFCEWLSKKEGKTYRLPTDEEWSVAVGLGGKEKHGNGITPEMLNGIDQTVFPWGDDYPPKTKDKAGNYGDTAWTEKFPIQPSSMNDYTDGYPTTAPVMSFEPNKLGLYDMGGNVWEWVEDWWNDTKTDRLMRGASFAYYDRRHLLASYRYHFEPGYRSFHFGFRVVLADGGVQPSVGSSAKPQSSGAPPYTASQNQPSSGKTVDLLRLIDPANDTVRGRWEWTPEGLKLVPKTAVSTIEFPYEPPEFYDFTIEFSVKEGKHRQVDQILTCQGVPTSWQMGAGYAPSGAFGLMMVDGIKAVDPNRTEAVALRERLSPDVRHRSTVQVRKNRISAILDGKEILNWEGEFSRLDLESQSRLKSVNRLGIGGFGTEAIFYLAELKAADESATKAMNAAPKLSEEMSVAAARGGRLRAWGNFYTRGRLLPIDVSKAAGYSDFVALAGDDLNLFALRKGHEMFGIESTSGAASVIEKSNVRRLFSDRVWPRYEIGGEIFRTGLTSILSIEATKGELLNISSAFSSCRWLSLHPQSWRCFLGDSRYSPP